MSRKTRILSIGIVALALALGGWTSASAQSVVNSRHDLSSGSTATFGAAAVQSNNVDRVCVFCHTPHQAATALRQTPLWNHTASTFGGQYGVYTSSTMNATPTNFGAGAIGTLNTSQLCMSCHDGTVGVGNLYNNPNGAAGEITPSNSAVSVSGNPLVGTDLRDDHPVNFEYTGALATADGGLNTPAGTNCVDTTGAADPCDIPLFDDGALNDTVQCASCHDPHNPVNIPFLRISNAASALCLRCHVK